MAPWTVQLRAGFTQIQIKMQWVRYEKSRIFKTHRQFARVGTQRVSTFRPNIWLRRLRTPLSEPVAATIISARATFRAHLSQVTLWEVQWWQARHCPLRIHCRLLKRIQINMRLWSTMAVAWIMGYWIRQLLNAVPQRSMLAASVLMTANTQTQIRNEEWWRPNLRGKSSKFSTSMSHQKLFKQEPKASSRTGHQLDQQAIILETSR